MQYIWEKHYIESNKTYLHYLHCVSPYCKCYMKCPFKRNSSLYYHDRNYWVLLTIVSILETSLRFYLRKKNYFHYIFCQFNIFNKWFFHNPNDMITIFLSVVALLFISNTNKKVFIRGSVLLLLEHLLLLQEDNPNCVRFIQSLRYISKTPSRNY